MEDSSYADRTLCCMHGSVSAVVRNVLCDVEMPAR